MVKEQRLWGSGAETKVPSPQNYYVGNKAPRRRAASDKALDEQDEPATEFKITCAKTQWRGASGSKGAPEANGKLT